MDLRSLRASEAWEKMTILTSRDSSLLAVPNLADGLKPPNDKITETGNIHLSGKVASVDRNRWVKAARDSTDSR
jgi:hypothetical protein